MKKYFIRILFCIFTIAFIFCITGYCENEVSDFLEKSGELGRNAISSDNSSVSFSYIKDYLKNIFFSEFAGVKNTFFTCFCIIIISSLFECINFESSVNEISKLSVRCACVIATCQCMSSFFEISKELLSELKDFIFFSIPYYGALLASTGKTLTASKGSLISLGSANVLSYLINNIFFPIVYLFYIVSVSSVMMKNDIFEALKKTIVSFERTILPIIVGLYTTVLSIFVKTSVNNDAFVLKATKTALGTAVPFLGNILTNSAETIVSSVGLIQSQVGIIATVALVYILSVPLIKILCGIIMFRVLGIISCFVGDGKMGDFSINMSQVLEFLIGMCATSACVFLISTMLLIS